jgi:mRNA-degrading endonuclease RelE of RelBE toxin-antitoxin system
MKKRTVEDILHNLNGTYKICATRVDFDKEFKKDTLLYEQISRVFSEISKDPFRGEPLRFGLKNKWRVPLRHHSHVIIYSIDRETRVVTIESYNSHNGAYGNHYKKRG